MQRASRRAVLRADTLVEILNSVHHRANAFVIRCEGENHEPRQFSTWGAKAVALIGRLPDTLEDRSIEIRMRRKSSREQVQRLRVDRLRC